MWRWSISTRPFHPISFPLSSPFPVWLRKKNGASTTGGRPFCPKHAPIWLDSAKGQSIVGAIQLDVSQRARICCGNMVENRMVVFFVQRAGQDSAVVAFTDRWFCQRLRLLPRRWRMGRQRTRWPVEPEGLCFSGAPSQRLWLLRWRTCFLSSGATPWSSRCGSWTFGCSLASTPAGRCRWCCAWRGTPGSGGCRRNPKAPYDPEPFAWTWAKRRGHY